MKGICPGTLKKYNGDDAEYRDYPIRVGIGQDFTIEGTITNMQKNIDSITKIQ